MLLSYVNTQLRDFYRSLDAFCEDRGLDRKELEESKACHIVEKPEELFYLAAEKENNG